MEAKIISELNTSSFDDALEKHTFIVVDFWAPWCQPCGMITPILEELAAEYKGKVKFAKVNVDDNNALASRYAVMSIPNIILFKNGKKFDDSIGVAPKEELKEKIDAMLGASESK